MFEEHFKVFIHSLFIPFLGGFIVTIAKALADDKTLSYNDANDIGLDMVLIAVGAIAIYHPGAKTADEVLDACIGDAFFAAILIYMKALRRKQYGASPPRINPTQGNFQLALGAAAIVCTVFAF